MRHSKSTIPSSCRALQILAIVIFFFLLLFLSLAVATSRRGLNKLVTEFVSEQVVEVGDDYMDHFEEYDISNKLANQLISSNEVKEVLSAVLSERLYSLFHNLSSYSVSYEECESKVSEFVREECEELSEEDIEAVTDYILDLSGVSILFIKDNPSDYKAYLFNSDSEDYEQIEALLNVIPLLSSAAFPFTLLGMYLFTIIILIVIGKRAVLGSTLANTSLYPSLALSGFALGEVLAGGTSEVVDYIFRIVLLFGVMGIVFGVVTFLISRKLVVKNY